MRAVKADQIEPRRLRPLRRVHEPTTQVANVGPVHRAGLHRIVGEGADRPGRGGQRHLLGVEIRPVDAGIGQLYPCQRAMAFHRLRHAPQGRNVGIVPKPQLDEGRDFGSMVHLGLLGEDDTPAAFRLHPPHRRDGRGVAIAAAIAMRHLIETVLRCQRADPDLLEQNIMSGIAHPVFPLFVARNAVGRRLDRVQRAGHIGVGLRRIYFPGPRNGLDRAALVDPVAAQVRIGPGLARDDQHPC